MVTCSTARNRPLEPSARPVPTDQPPLPSRLEDFAIGEALGTGAMARVLEAVERKSGRPVAIKLLDGSARGSHELRERLAREARLLASVESPHVSRLLDHGWEGDQPFLVLERLRGETLADTLRREGRIPVGRLVEWVEQLLVGVRDCHRVNVIHRDIKPANIFLAQPETPGSGEPTVKLIDFGVARLNDIVSVGSGLTNTHHLIGSVGYMAPEQFESARNVGPPADIYGVGVVIFRCVTGRLPFVSRSLAVLTKLKCEAAAPLVSSVTGAIQSDALDGLVSRALALKPADRFPSASEMLEEWWRVAASLDRGDLPAVDVAFDEDEWVSTLVESLASVPPGGSGFPSSTLRVVAVRAPDEDMKTDPDLRRPSDASIPASQDPPAER
jgi:serine/threonine-protein kinase